MIIALELSFMLPDGFCTRGREITASAQSHPGGEPTGSEHPNAINQDSVMRIANKPFHRSQPFDKRLLSQARNRSLSTAKIPCSLVDTRKSRSDMAFNRLQSSY
jgi:hypothetical protein